MRSPWDLESAWQEYRAETRAPNPWSGLVSEKSKRDGADGFFITPLYGELKKKVETLKKALERLERPFVGNLKIRAPKQMTYRLLSELIYTANQADLGGEKVLELSGDSRPRHAIVVKTPRMGKRRVSPVEAQVAIPKTVDAEAKKALKRKLDSRPIRVTTRSSLRGFASAATNADDDAPPDPCPLSALPSPKSRVFFSDRH